MAESEPPPSDPFAAFESERTVIKPSAGRGPRTSAIPPTGGPGFGVPPTAAGAGGASAALPPEVAAVLPSAPGLNPIVQAAAPLLALAPRLRAMVRHPSPAGLRAALVEAVHRFEAGVRAAGVPNEQVVAARYVLCTFIDESASGTPWGGSGAWSTHSLLVAFHNESWGGEKVFQLLSRLAQNPEQHRHLLELVYVVLALGFEGRYKVVDNGRAQLDQLRQRLAAAVRPAAVPAELSTQWQGVVPPSRRLRDGVPIWVVATIIAALLALVFFVLRLTLAAQTDTTFTALQGLGSAAPVAAAAPPPPVPAAPPPPRLAALLAAEIQAKQVVVRDDADRSVVTLPGDGMFGAGSADVRADELPLLARVGAALAKVPGTVLISGHTDSVPIRSLRYPSNWHLSKDRALAVRDVLARGVPPARLTAEGRADTEPVDDNGSAQGRARNRRVEITLTPTGDGEAPK
ncbi:MAG: DotU family type VI secretion system protein [Rubrivivax sp.]